MSTRFVIARARTALAGFLLAGIVLLGMNAGSAPAAPGEKAERHPHIHKAIHQLKEARKELKEAPHDFGGHREEAVDAIDKAIKQLEIALKFDKK